MVGSDGITKETYKTSVRKNNPNPVFNEVAVFKVATRHLKSVSIKIFVYESPNEYNEFVIGSVCIDARQKYLDKNNTYFGHWQQMLRLLRRSVIFYNMLIFVTILYLY